MSTITLLQTLSRLSLPERERVLEREAKDEWLGLMRTLVLRVPILPLYSLS